MRCSFLKAAAVAVVLAAMAAKAAADSYISSVPLATGVLSSPRFLWVAANVIVVWLVSSYRRYKAASSAGAGAGNVDDVSYAMGMGLYPSSGHDAFALAAVAADLVDVAAPVATVSRRKQPREARPGKRRSTDRPRVRKVSAGGETPRAVAAEAMPEVKKHVVVEDEWPSWAVAVTETELLAKKSVAATAGKPAIKKSVVEEDWLSWTVAATVAKPAAKKPVVEEEWLSWTMASTEVKPDVKKPIVEDEWSSWIIAATETKPDVKNPVVEDEWPVGWTVATTSSKPSVKKPVVEDEWPSWTSGTAIDAKPTDDKKPGEWAITAAANPKPDDVDGDDDVSMDSMWESILQRGARPVTVRKSDTWGSDEQPRLERAAETAVTRKEIRRSATATNMMVPPSPPHVPAPPAPANHGWRTREVLPAMRHDELMRRAESFIRRHHEQLQLQRQESEQRQALELQRRRPAQLIRV
ncbi:hypothetical protein ABZP36_010486 [Zizania latifolia]